MQLFAAKRVVLILYHYTCILYRTDFTIDMTLHMSLLSFQVCELDIIFNFEKVRCLCLKLYGKTMYIYIYILSFMATHSGTSHLRRTSF